MIRKEITIQKNRFIVDFFNFNKDNVGVYNNFSFIRRFNVMNGIAYDTDIYIIENIILNKVIDEITDNHTTTSIVFPICTETTSQYSNLFSNFSISSDNVLKRNVYKLYNYDETTNTISEAKIKCDKIRIYHPDEQILVNNIIHVNSLYNNIRFHYFCQPISNLSSKINEHAFIVHNKHYAEYLEFYIPNAESLFKFNNNYIYNKYGDNKLDILRDSDNIYFCEDMNVISTNNNYDSKILLNVYESNKQQKEIYNNVNISLDVIKINKKMLTPFNTLLLPFYIDKLTARESYAKFGDYGIYYEKRFTNNIKTIDNNYLTSPINITFFQYTGITSNYYNPTVIGNEHTVSVSEAYKFTLNASLGFDNNICSIICNFDYPNKETYVKKYGDETTALQQAYKDYNNITNQNYTNATFVMFKDEVDFFKQLNNNYNVYYKIESENSNNITHKYINVKYKKVINKIGKTEFWLVDKDGDLTKRIQTSLYYEFYKKETYLYDEIDEDDYNINTPIISNDITVIGYTLFLASDKKFKNIIYTRTAQLNFIEDAAFNLNNIFYSWNNMPDIIIAKVVFIDRIIGRAVNSNTLVITKEWFKYLINNTDYKYRLSLTNMSVDYDILHNIENNKFIVSSYSTTIKENNINENMDLSYINFIDKINCIVNKSETNNIVNNYGFNNKLIYKPIFYRTYELQNIRLHSGIKQNIGINLADYLTKVETFNLIIDGKTYAEIARNDVYVIFNINTSILENSYGIYTITNQDNEYISDGNWVTY